MGWGRVEKNLPCPCAVPTHYSSARPAPVSLLSLFAGVNSSIFTTFLSIVLAPFARINASRIKLFPLQIGQSKSYN